MSCYHLHIGLPSGVLRFHKQNVVCISSFSPWVLVYMFYPSHSFILNYFKILSEDFISFRTNFLLILLRGLRYFAVCWIFVRDFIALNGSEMKRKGCRRSFWLTLRYYPSTAGSEEKHEKPQSGWSASGPGPAEWKWVLITQPLAVNLGVGWVEHTEYVPQK
jgi:hypothetical protein